MIMNDKIVLSQEFEITGGDFSNAGKTSTSIKEILQEIGIDPTITIRASIASYEAEMNAVMHGSDGTLTLTVDDASIIIEVRDNGPGIEDIEMALQEGYSTALTEHREMGFGAGMGLPNIRKNSDDFNIASEVGTGTTVSTMIRLDQSA